MGHITIFIMVFAVGDSAVNNKSTLTVYVSECLEMHAVHAGVVNVSIE